MKSRPIQYIVMLRGRFAYVIRRHAASHPSVRWSPACTQVWKKRDRGLIIHQFRAWRSRSRRPPGLYIFSRRKSHHCIHHSRTLNFNGLNLTRTGFSYTFRQPYWLDDLDRDVRSRRHLATLQRILLIRVSHYWLRSCLLLKLNCRIYQSLISVFLLQQNKNNIFSHDFSNKRTNFKTEMWQRANDNEFRQRIRQLVPCVCCMLWWIVLAP
jgi:hypothetical protein